MDTIVIFAPNRTLRQAAAVETLREDLLTYAGGFSEYAGKGVWRGPQGQMYSEPHVRFEVFSATSKTPYVVGAAKHYAWRAGKHTLCYVLNGGSDVLGGQGVSGPYKVERLFFNRPNGRRLIAEGLTLEEAQAHCSDPKTSSSTCTSAEGKRRTARGGPWFDSYTEEK